MTWIHDTAKWNHIKRKNLSVSVHSILDRKFVSQLTLSANAMDSRSLDLILYFITSF